VRLSPATTTRVASFNDLTDGRQMRVQPWRTGNVSGVRMEWGLLTVRSLQHSLAIVLAGVAKTIVSVQPFL